MHYGPLGTSRVAYRFIYYCRVASKQCLAKLSEFENILYVYEYEYFIFADGILYAVRNRKVNRTVNRRVFG